MVSASLILGLRAEERMDLGAATVGLIPLLMYVTPFLADFITLTSENSYHRE